MPDLITDTIAEALRAPCLDGNGNAVGGDRGRAAIILAALKAQRLVVIELPEVAHKGPHDTDAMFFRQVAERMDFATKPINYLSGSNVRNAVRQLLYRAADAAQGVRS